MKRREFLEIAAISSLVAQGGLPLIGAVQADDVERCPRLKKGQPIWLEGRSEEMNTHAGFHCSLDVKAVEKYVMHICAVSYYRLYVNGELCMYGPARGAHGFLRVDMVDITPHLRPGANLIAVEVNGYNAKSFYGIKQPAFLQAEIECGGTLIAWTGLEGDFKAFPFSMREQKVVRFSYQRGFTEHYDLAWSDPVYRWKERTLPVELYGKLETNERTYQYLPREVPIPDFALLPAPQLCETGTAACLPRQKYRHTRFTHYPSSIVDLYDPAEMKENLHATLQELTFSPQGDAGPSPMPTSGLTIKQGEYRRFSFDTIKTGFIKSTFTATADSEVYLVFFEYLPDETFTSKGVLGQLTPVIKLDAAQAKQRYNVESFEPNSLKHIYVYVRKGSIHLDALSLREYVAPNHHNAQVTLSDRKLQDIFDASIETYRQNTMDVFLDCPGRERAGWLCDGYFTGFTERLFTGKNVVEKVMLENFTYPGSFPDIPKGMLPYCYPADNFGHFHHTWVMWYVLEVDAYLRRDHTAEAGVYRNVISGIIDFFNKRFNQEGFLENLPGNPFIEGSLHFKIGEGVNFPVNMLYAATLRAAARILDKPALLARADALKTRIVSMSFDGHYFIDVAVRDETGTLRVTDNRSETCQYHAAFCDMFDRDDPRFAKLTDTILNTFGRENVGKLQNPEIISKGVFFTHVLRFAVLTKWRQYTLLLDDLKDYLWDQVHETGTLWEHLQRVGSLNHGYVSYAAPAMVQAVFGLKGIDDEKKIITFDFSHQKIEAGSLTLGTLAGPLKVNTEYRRRDGKYVITCMLPKPYKAHIIEQHRLPDNVQIECL